MSLPFFSGVVISSGGTTDYNALSDRPVTNITGAPVVISELSTGVYSIHGTWAMTEDSEPVQSLDDDLFYVKNDANGVRMTWISAGGIHTYGVEAGGSAEDVVEDSIATTESVVESLVGDF